MIEQIQNASWPGVLGFESVTGTISHGIRPATFVCQTIPQLSKPAGVGKFALTDGKGLLILHDCKVDDLIGRLAGDGQTYTMTILDRRWKWATGEISGRYNVRDTRGKLVPWTIRSPRELAELCLQKAGEKNFVINLPPGLPKAAGKDVDRFLRLGENFPQTLANPTTIWDRTPPMIALSQLAAKYGCRVIWQPLKDRVLVGPPGAGAPLPEGYCEVIAPSIDVPESPIAVGVASAPVRWQMRLQLEAVGLEWDGSYLPVKDLSYAPTGPGDVQISTVTWSGATSNPSVKVYITYVPSFVDPVAPVEVRYEYGDAVSAATKLARIVTQINGNPAVGRFIRATSSGDVLTLTGRQAGYDFQVWADTSAAAPDRLTAEVVQPATNTGVTWAACGPPNFCKVRATNELSYPQAVDLARRSVYRCFRVTEINPATGRPGIEVPHYTLIGEKRLRRRHQLILQPTKVEQVRPQPRGLGGLQQGVAVVDPAAVIQLGGIMPEFYNGYSRDAKAVAYGSIARTIGSVTWNPPAVFSMNTAPSDRIYVEFSVDPVEQVITFAEPIYEAVAVAGVNASYKFPTVILETGVLVTDVDSGALVRWEFTQTIPEGSAPTEWSVRDDIQIGVIGEYNDSHQIIRTVLPDLGDATREAEFILDGMAHKYKFAGGETRQYIGIVPHDLDGYCQQMTLSVGAGGATTVLSGNSEHSPVIPDFLDRQRDENLPPDKKAAEANLREQEVYDRVIPPVPGAVK